MRRSTLHERLFKTSRFLTVSGVIAAAAALAGCNTDFVTATSERALKPLSSELAAEIYRLQILKPDMEDAAHNTTRFVILSRAPDDAEPDNGPVITTLVFHVRNVPAALYKALGGFATNGVNITKLESYQLEGSFSATQFYADIEGHPQDRLVRLAIEELEFFSTKVKVLGVYPADPFRSRMKPA